MAAGTFPPSSPPLEACPHMVGASSASERPAHRPRVLPPPARPALHQQTPQTPGSDATPAASVLFSDAVQMPHLRVDRGHFFGWHTPSTEGGSCGILLSRPQTLSLPQMSRWLPVNSPHRWGCSGQSARMALRSRRASPPSPFVV